MNTRLKVRAYGRDLEIVRVKGRWKAYERGNEGKNRLARDVVIPSSLQQEDMVGYLSDLLHEYASPKHQRVIRVE